MDRTLDGPIEDPGIVPQLQARIIELEFTLQEAIDLSLIMQRDRYLKALEYIALSPEDREVLVSVAKAAL